MRRTALRRSTKRMKKTPLRKVSKKHAKELEKYYKLRDQFLKDHPYCEICGQRSTEVHHRKGRGKYLNIRSTWMAVERNCHDMIHRNGKLSREHGWLISKFK